MSGPMESTRILAGRGRVEYRFATFLGVLSVGAGILNAASMSY